MPLMNESVRGMTQLVVFVFEKKKNMTKSIEKRKVNQLKTKPFKTSSQKINIFFLFIMINIQENDC